MAAMSFPELMYYAETDGLLPNRKGKINKLIKMIKNYPYPTVSEDVFRAMTHECDIVPSSLTEKEIKYIKTAIKKI